MDIVCHEGVNAFGMRPIPEDFCLNCSKKEVKKRRTSIGCVWAYYRASLEPHDGGLKLVFHVLDNEELTCKDCAATTSASPTASTSSTTKTQAIPTPSTSTSATTVSATKKSPLKSAKRTKKNDEYIPISLEPNLNEAVYSPLTPNSAVKYKNKSKTYHDMQPASLKHAVHMDVPEGQSAYQAVEDFDFSQLVRDMQH